MILVDIGTHAYHLSAYVTGLDLESLCADVGHVVPGRKVDDYVSLLLKYANGARGSMWVTNAASGAEHGLCFHIFGETGGLEWHQEEPNRLVHRKRDGFEEIITRRPDSLVSEDARRVTRLQIGHPEGYIEAFANLYSDFARTVVARMSAESPGKQASRKASGFSCSAALMPQLPYCCGIPRVLHLRHTIRIPGAGPQDSKSLA